MGYGRRMVNASFGKSRYGRNEMRARGRKDIFVVRKEGRKEGKKSNEQGHTYKQPHHQPFKLGPRLGQQVEPRQPLGRRSIPFCPFPSLFIPFQTMGRC